MAKFVQPKDLAVNSSHHWVYSHHFPADFALRLARFIRSSASISSIAIRHGHSGKDFATVLVTFSETEPEPQLVFVANLGGSIGVCKKRERRLHRSHLSVH
jgi:hypothetical protein